MDIRQLQEFVDLAKTCNFQKTAENLNTSQPCISKHVHKLEEELDVELFDRTSRNVKLNKFGSAFAAYAQKIVDLHMEAINEINSLRHISSNCLSVGFHPILGQYGFVELLSDFGKEHPEISVNLFESANLEDMLKTHQCHIVFAPENELSSKNLRSILYMRDRLAIICSDSHPLAKERTVTLSQLQDETFIVHSMSPNGISELTNFQRLCGENEFTPKIAATVSRTATAVRFVSQGKGIAVLFRKHVPNDLTGIKLIDIVPELPVNICVFYLKSPRLPAAASTFFAYMKSVKSC